MELTQRTDAPAGYYNATVNGEKYSVVYFGTTMASMPNLEAMRAAGLFLGWEAIKIKANGKLNHDTLIRGETWDDLKEKLV